VTDVSSASIEADIARLETRLRQLKVQYDMFFNGALPREPFELRADVERLIKRYSNAPIRKYAQRFHFNSLVSRFNSLSELWTKTIRNLEEGDRPSPAAAGRGPSEKVLTTCRIHDPIKEQELLRFVHSRYLEARRKMGGANGKVSFSDFVRGITSQAKSLRDKSGCDEIELRLIVADQKVHLKARPGR
jgi:hypothetical protein